MQLKTHILSRSIREARIRQIFEGGQTLRLQYPKEDLGFAYPTSTDGPAANVADFIAQWKQTPEERARPFVPVVQEGVRFPHVVLRTADGSPRSTVDLVADAGLDFTLLVSGETAVAVARTGGVLWREILGKRPGRRALVVVGGPGEAAGAGEVPAQGEAQVVFDPTQALEALPGWAPFVLVRPDGHVLWKGSDLSGLPEH